MEINCPECGKTIKRRGHCRPGTCYYYVCSCGYEDAQYDTLDEKRDAEEHFREDKPNEMEGEDE